MALTEIQLPIKADFYQGLRSVAGEMKSRMLRWKELSEFLAKMGTVDMDAMGIPAGEVRTDLTDFRVALNEVISLFEGNAVTPINSPEVVMDKFRKMLIN